MGRKALKDKRKRIKVKLIKRIFDSKVTEPYRILEQIIETSRKDLADLKFALAWHNGWRADADGRVKMGFCKKRSDIDKELDEFDFIIFLNENAWPGLSDVNKERLIYHELCHAQVCIDKNGQKMFDDKSRLVCRVRKHDVEDFSDVIKKYGHRESFEQIGKKAIESAQTPLLDAIEKGVKGQKGLAEQVAADETLTPDYKIDANKNIENPTVITIKFPKTFGLSACIKYGKYFDDWFVNSDIQHRVKSQGGPVSIEGQVFKTAATAIRTEALKLCKFINGLFDEPKALKAKKLLEKQVDEYLEKF